MDTPAGVNLPPESGELESGRRATLADVARAAGVSLATADRVMHRRKGVRETTKQCVIQAAQQLNYLPQEALAAMLRSPPRRLAFLLPTGSNRFIDLLADYANRVGEQLSPYNVLGHVRWVEAFNPEKLSEEMMKQAAISEAIAFVPLEHPLIREATNRIVEMGKPVITLASDMTNTRRTAYVGLDNYAAGRSAGLVMGRWCDRAAGNVIMIRGSLSYRGHGERELGFRHLLQEMFPNLQIAGVGDGLDEAHNTYRQANELLSACRGVVGVYNIGGGSEGAMRALREAGLAGKAVVIGHELNPETRSFLINGSMAAIIHQNAQIEVMNCVRILSNVYEGKRPQEGIDPIRIGLIIRENLP